MVKKASGYVAEETQEEYALVEGDMQLVKRKVIRKDVPPDLAALKMLLNSEPPEEVTEEELRREREELEEKYYAMKNS